MLTRFRAFPHNHMRTGGAGETETETTEVTKGTGQSSRGGTEARGRTEKSPPWVSVPRAALRAATGEGWRQIQVM
jgi:hypothetical protein